MKPYYDINLIGSSLGGYFALVLGKKYDLKIILLNPVTINIIEDYDINWSE